MRIGEIMIHEIESIPQSGQAVQWDGANTDEVAEFAGRENCAISAGTFQIKSAAEDRWRDMFPGYWVSKGGDGMTTLHSPEAFRRLWRVKG